MDGKDVAIMAALPGPKIRIRELAKEDYEPFVPEFERLVRAHGSWAPGATFFF